MKAKKLLALILALAMTVTLVACGNKDGDTTNDGDASGEPITLVCANKSDPGNYGPYGSSSDRKMYQLMLFEAMMFKNADGEIENVLVESYESLGNGVYRLHLYDYIHDTAGNPVKASDVVFSFEKAIENGSYGSVLSSFDHFEIVDENTLDMHLVNESAGSFIVICCAINIVSEKAWNDSGDEMVHNAVGTTPYKLKEYVEGSYALYEKTNDYWQTDESKLSTRGQANPDFVKWVTVSDNSAAAVTLQTGETDHTKGINAKDYALFMDEEMNPLEDYKVAAIKGNMTYGVTFNSGDKSPCADVNLRKAICYAIDSEAIADNIFGSYARAAGNYVNHAYGDYDESLEDLDNYYRYDADKAADYLAKSNYKGEKLKLLVCPMGQAKNIGPLVQGYLMQAGIDCEVMLYDTAIYNSYLYDETGTEWDLVVTGDSGTTGAEYMWSVLYAADNRLNDFGNLMHVEDPTLQSLYEEMASVDGNSTESLGAYLDYVNENCYQYLIMNFYKFSFAGNQVKTLVTDFTGEIICGACEVG